MITALKRESGEVSVSRNATRSLADQRHRAVCRRRWLQIGRSCGTTLSTTTPKRRAYH